MKRLRPLNRRLAAALRPSLLLALFVLLGLTPCAAAPPITVLDPARETQELGGALLVIADPDNAFTMESVASGEHDAEALKLPARAPLMGYPRHRYWTRFALHNAGAKTIERLLLLRRGSKFAQDLLLDDGATRRRIQIGVGTANPTGDLATVHSVLQIQLQPGKTLLVTAAVTTWASLILDYRVLSEHQLDSDDRREYLVFGGVGGFGVAISAYVLLIGLMTRQNTYLWFALLAFGSLAYPLYFEGFLGRFALSEFEQRSIAVLLGLGAAVGGAMFFLRTFLETPRTQPRLDRFLLRPLSWASPVVVLAVLIKPWPFWMIGALWGLLCVLTNVVTVFLALLRNQLPVRSFGIAVLIWLVFSIVFFLQLQGVVADDTQVQERRLLLLAATQLTFAFAVSERLRQQVQASFAAVKRNEALLAELVDERTGQYRAAKERAEHALAHLMQAQQHLVQSEKMASLGHLVAGVAHEVNTPLGVALTANSHLELKSHEVAGQFQSGALRKSDVQQFIGAAEESTSMIQRNLKRAAHLIQSFKQVSVDRTSDGRRCFDLQAFITELVESLALTWKHRPVTLTVDCPKDLTLDSFPGALGQVLTNLIQNALLHAFEPNQPGAMRIAVRAIEPVVNGPAQIELEFSDNGKGASNDVIAHIFEPFFTTKRNQGGTGLGMHVAYNLVAQKLGGEIRVEGAPGAGLCFRLRLPTQTHP